MELTDSVMHQYMLECISLARSSNPSIFFPRTGALVVNQRGEIIGRGQKKFMSPTNIVVHAERCALEEAGTDAANSVLFATWDPCFRDKPKMLKSCTDLILDYRIKTVVSGFWDLSVNNIYIAKMPEYFKARGVQLIRYKGLRESILDELMGPRYL